MHRYVRNATKLLRKHLRDYNTKIRKIEFNSHSNRKSYRYIIFEINVINAKNFGGKETVLLKYKYRS